MFRIIFYYGPQDRLVYDYIVAFFIRADRVYYSTIDVVAFIITPDRIDYFKSDLVDFFMKLPRVDYYTIDALS